MSCSLRGAHVFELKDGGGEVEELLGAAPSPEGGPMSLMSRVRDIDDVPTLAASADDNALERLKEHIQRFVSTDDIAAIMAEQPSRARNELKSACRQAFEDASWAGVSQREQQRLTDGLIDMVFGFGPLESLLADDSVTEIMVNGPSDVFFERSGSPTKASCARSSIACWGRWGAASTRRRPW